MRAIVIILPMIGTGVLGFAAGYFVAKGGRSSVMGADEREMRLKEHARLLVESRAAHLRGELGQADALERAAMRVLDDDELRELG